MITWLNQLTLVWSLNGQLKLSLYSKAHKPTSCKYWIRMIKPLPRCQLQYTLWSRALHIKSIFIDGRPHWSDLLKYHLMIPKYKEKWKRQTGLSCCWSVNLKLLEMIGYKLRICVESRGLEFCNSVYRLSFLRNQRIEFHQTSGYLLFLIKRYSVFRNRSKRMRLTLIKERIYSVV